MTIEFPLSSFVMKASLPIALYGREIWSFTLREEHTLSVFVNCRKTDEVTMGEKTT